MNNYWFEALYLSAFGSVIAFILLYIALPLIFAVAGASGIFIGLILGAVCLWMKYR